jgi:nucleotide-binding universal stress UspA family protein
MSVRPIVVVPVDDSPATEATVAYAASIARARAADLHAIQVVPREGGLWVAPRNEVRLRARLRAMRASVERDGLSLRIVTLRGAPASAIAAYAQLRAAVLTVVDRHYRASRLWRSTSVARRLSRVSPVPVLVVSRRMRSRSAFPVRRIVAAVDFTAASAVSLRAAIDLASRHGARVTMVHALEAPRHMLLTGSEAWRAMTGLEASTKVIAGRLKRQARAFGSRDAESLVVTGDPHRGIARAVVATAADLVVMGVAPRRPIEEMLFGSTLRAVLRCARVPILVLPVVDGARDWTGERDDASSLWNAEATVGRAA